MSADIQFTELEEIVGAIEICCDYDNQFYCGEAAQWEMRLACDCGYKAVRLSGDQCKVRWLNSDVAAECPVCGLVTAPARHLFWHVEKLKF